MMTIAESGERKSTVDSILLGPVHELEKNLAEQFEQDYQDYNHALEIATVEKKALNTELIRKVKRQKDNASIKAALEEIRNNYPEAPVRYRLIFNDATPAALKAFLCGTWNSVGLMSDEAGTIFGGSTLSDLPLFNKIWDGKSVSVDRKGEPEMMINDARMTLSLMLQPEVFTTYLGRRGNMAKGVGFFARCLVSYPESTQGYRQITAPAPSLTHVPLFHARLMELVNESLENKGNEKICLSFSPEAENLWLAFFNEYEGKMGPAGYYKLANFKEFTSKVAESVARIAALLQYFHDSGEVISTIAMQAAIALVTWYGEEHVRLFDKPDGTDELHRDAHTLHMWLINWCAKSGAHGIRKAFIPRYAPSHLRNTAVINLLLEHLEFNKKIIIDRGRGGKSEYIRLSWTTQPTNTFQGGVIGNYIPGQ